MQDRNFRSVPTAGFPEGVFADPRNPLILVDKFTLSQYANKVEDKKILLQDLVNNGLTTPDDFILLFTWQGKFKSDVFEIKTSQVEQILNTL